MAPNRGSVLIFVLVTLVVLAAGVTTVVASTVMQARVTREYDQFTQAFHNANAALEYLEFCVKASPYGANGTNTWLQDHSSLAGVTLTSGSLPELAETGASITITREAVGSPWYHVEARCPAGSIGKDRIIEVWVREREPFSEYMFFVGSGITFGETTVAGRVHANGSITFNQGSRNPGTNEPAKFWDEVSSTSGYSFTGGGSFEELFTIYNPDGSVKYVTDHDFNVAVRPMPQTNDIDSLYSVAGAGYVANSSVEFVTRWDAGLGEYVTKVIIDDNGTELPLPPGGVIGSDTDDLSITGTMVSSGGTTYDVAAVNGRVTIVNKSNGYGDQISISSPIVYIDKNGEPYYQHMDSSGNYYDYRTPNYFADSQKDIWYNNEFVRNPSYTGNSAVGLVAARDIRYGVGTPSSTSMEIDAAILANGGFGYWHDNRVKRNLRIVGSLTFNSSYGRYSGSPVTGYGYSYSGIYQYDQKLRGNAPPHFLGTARPEFFAWRAVQ
jgi:hypothetical protein